MSQRDPSSLAWDDGVKRPNMLRRTRSEQSRRASRRRANNFCKVLHDLQQQVARGTHHGGEGICQRFDDFRNRRSNTNNNRINQLLNLDEHGIQEEKSIAQSSLQYNGGIPSLTCRESGISINKKVTTHSAGCIAKLTEWRQTKQNFRTYCIWLRPSTPTVLCQGWGKLAILPAILTIVLPVQQTVG